MVYIDNTPITFKQNEFKNLTCSYQTDKDRVNIKVYKALDIGGIWWFAIQLFFFVISIFGLLDVRMKNRFVGLQYESDVELGDGINNIALGFNSPNNNSKAFDVKTDLQIVENSNKFFIDEDAKKKIKFLNIAKIVLAIVIIVTVTAVMFIKLK